jgi:hypothetical protein
MHNALSSLSPGHFATTPCCGKRVTTVTIGLLLLVLMNAVAHAGPAEVDDGWRRTRFGWENIKNWDLSPAQRELPTAATFSTAEFHPAIADRLSLLHPCVLAAGLSLLAVGALCLTMPQVGPVCRTGPGTASG